MIGFKSLELTQFNLLCSYNFIKFYLRSVYTTKGIFTALFETKFFYTLCLSLLLFLIFTSLMISTLECRLETQYFLSLLTVLLLLSVIFQIAFFFVLWKYTFFYLTSPKLCLFVSKEAYLFPVLFFILQLI